MYDLAIIGGGPAGASLARMINTRWGKQYTVLLVDRRRLTKEPQAGSYTKCCGGLLAPDAQKALGRMGLALPGSVLVGPQIFAVRTIDLEVELERYYQRFYINIDREKFDRWLISLVSKDVDILDECVFKSYEQAEDGYRLRLLRKGGLIETNARLIVGADGAFSKVRKLAFGFEKWPKKYISIQKWYGSSKILPFFGAIFDSEITDFYSWIIPKENTLILGTALEIGNGVQDKFELLKSKLEKKYEYEFGDEINKEGAFILRPLNIGNICTGKKGIVLIGEAAGWISPSSAEGLSYAFRSAMALTEALEGGIIGLENRYRRKCSGLFLNVLIKNAKSPVMYNPWIRRGILKTGVQSLKMWELFRP